MPVPTKILSGESYALLEMWFRMTREANIRSAFPDIKPVWVRRGTAYVPALDGFTPKSTAPRETMRWEEAGLIFMRCCIDSTVESLVLYFLFGPMPEESNGHTPYQAMINDAARRHGMDPRTARRLIQHTLKAYQDELEARGIVWPKQRRKTRPKRRENGRKTSL